MKNNFENAIRSGHGEGKKLVIIRLHHAYYSEFAKYCKEQGISHNVIGADKDNTTICVAEKDIKEYQQLQREHQKRK